MEEINQEKLDELLNKLDNGEITVEQVPKEYIKPLCIAYDKRIEKCKNEINDIEKEKELYKKRFQDAISYLKYKNNT